MVVVVEVMVAAAAGRGGDAVLHKADLRREVFLSSWNKHGKIY